MTQPIVLKSLEELGRFADLVAPAEQPSNERALVPVVVQPIEAPNLDALAEAASRAAEELRELAAADARARQEAEETLARYRRLQGDTARLERLASEAQAVVDHASILAERAFTPDCRRRAEEIATTAVAVGTVARNRMAAVNAEVAALAVREDVAHLLAEERTREEAARREAGSASERPSCETASAEPRRWRESKSLTRPSGCWAHSGRLTPAVPC